MARTPMDLDDKICQTPAWWILHTAVARIADCRYHGHACRHDVRWLLKDGIPKPMRWWSHSVNEFHSVIVLAAKDLWNITLKAFSDNTSAMRRTEDSSLSDTIIYYTILYNYAFHYLYTCNSTLSICYDRRSVIMSTAIHSTWGLLEERTFYRRKPT